MEGPKPFRRVPVSQGAPLTGNLRFLFAKLLATGRRVLPVKRAIGSLVSTYYLRYCSTCFLRGNDPELTRSRAILHHGSPKLGRETKAANKEADRYIPVRSAE